MHYMNNIFGSGGGSSTPERGTNTPLQAEIVNVQRFFSK